MASVGLVAGYGPSPPSTTTVASWRSGSATILRAPSIVIDSLDVRRGLHLVEHDRPGLIEYLLASVRRLAGAGVDFAAMTANTPHIVFDEIAFACASAYAEHRRQRRRH